MNRRRASCWLLPLLAIAACDSAAPPAPQSQPAVVVAQTQPAVEPPPPPAPLLAEGYLEWEPQQALAALAGEDAQAMLTGAVRLAQQAELLPEDVGDTFAADLQVHAVGDLGWVLGVRLPVEENVEAEIRITPLQMPVWIRKDGAIDRSADFHRELTVFYPSRDIDIFPHLLIAPADVFALQPEGLVVALVASDLRGGWFHWHFNRGYPYVYVHHPDADNQEITRYRWDPYESVFMGPLLEEAPDGGRISLLLDRCKLLIPVGGIVPTVEAAEETEFPEDLEAELPPF